MLSPSGGIIENTGAVYGTSSATYNQASSYNESTLIYGGSDTKRGKKPDNSSILIVKPQDGGVWIEKTESEIIVNISPKSGVIQNITP